MNNTRPFRLILGMSGATGQIYGIRLLEALRNDPQVETHLIMSEWSKKTIGMETEYTPNYVIDLADYHYDINNQAAAISSGSFHRDAMIILPCTMKTLSAVAHSFNANILIRAADVTLKEHKPLVLVARETPLHSGHLSTMSQAANAGAILVPPVPAFYNNPQTVNDIVMQTVTRILDLVGLEKNLSPRWSGVAMPQQDNYEYKNNVR